jgi:hypothetical protein
MQTSKETAKPEEKSNRRTRAIEQDSVVDGTNDMSITPEG